MSRWNANDYGPTLAKWLSDRPAMALDAGPAGHPHQTQRREVSIANAYSTVGVKDVRMAESVLAGLWLAHNDLHAAHEICQSIDTPTGSYWHAIMHRREGDFSNSKYWFRRVGSHPIYPALHQRAGELARHATADSAAGFLTAQSQWNPSAFVDLVEQCIRGRSASGGLALAIQQCEWELLFDFCYRAAIED